MLIEVCCGSVDDILRAETAGAQRVELNSSLFLGGITPSIGELQLAKEKVKIPVISMIRPRSGGFYYTESEFESMKRDAVAFINAGTDGIVFGILNEDGTIDEERNAVLANIGISAGIDIVFHRAIDVVPCWEKSLYQLINLGFTRILTTGQQANVEDGAKIIKSMVEYSDYRIEILPGGLKPHNISQLSSYMGTNQAHIASFRQLQDRSCQHNQNIFFGGALYPPEMVYDVIDSNFVSQTCNKLRENN